VTRWIDAGYLWRLWRSGSTLTEPFRPDENIFCWWCWLWLRRKPTWLASSKLHHSSTGFLCSSQTHLKACPVVLSHSFVLSQILLPWANSAGLISQEIPWFISGINLTKIYSYQSSNGHRRVFWEQKTVAAASWMQIRYLVEIQGMCKMTNQLNTIKMCEEGLQKTYTSGRTPFWKI
jgi:hypothetical protein